MFRRRPGDAGAVGESDLAGARGEDSELGEGGVEEGGGGKQEAGAGEHEEAVEHVLGEGVGWGAKYKYGERHSRCFMRGGDVCDF